MTVYEVISSAQPAGVRALPRSRAADQAARAAPPGLWRRLAAWLATCADYYEAAALYEEFRGLADAELARRGLNRSTLGWDVCQACDRSADRPLR
jgi:hypothetical protein